jgi:transposase
MNTQVLVNRRRLPNALWNKIEGILLKIKDPRGRTPAQPDREFIEAVVYIIRTGIPWRDLPHDLGHWHNVYVRFRRWEKAGYWQALWREISKPEHRQLAALFIDSTSIRAHPHAAGAPKKKAAVRLWDARGEA